MLSKWEHIDEMETDEGSLENFPQQYRLFLSVLEEKTSLMHELAAWTIIQVSIIMKNAQLDKKIRSFKTVQNIHLFIKQCFYKESFELKMSVKF